MVFCEEGLNGQPRVFIAFRGHKGYIRCHMNDRIVAQLTKHVKRTDHALASEPELVKWDAAEEIICDNAVDSIQCKRKNPIQETNCSCEK